MVVDGVVVGGGSFGGCSVSSAVVMDDSDSDSDSDGVSSFGSLVWTGMSKEMYCTYSCQRIG